jgi:hypothetical protein
MKHIRRRRRRHPLTPETQKAEEKCTYWLYKAYIMETETVISYKKKKKLRPRRRKAASTAKTSPLVKKKTATVNPARENIILRRKKPLFII